MKGSSILVARVVPSFCNLRRVGPELQIHRQRFVHAPPATPVPTRTPARQPHRVPMFSNLRRQQPAARRTRAKPKITGNETPGSQSVIAAFNALVNGIRHADAKAVASVYLNSPRLILFNSNGTVTRGWEQMRKNRESSYAM